MAKVIVSGPFDRLQCRDMRFLHEASLLGEVHVLLWSDDLTGRLCGQLPAYPVAERQYVLDAVRYVNRTTVLDALPDANHLPADACCGADTWLVAGTDDATEKKNCCRQLGLQYEVVAEDRLRSITDNTTSLAHEPQTNRRVLVTGCFDFFHSGHVRFFEEVSQFGDLYVVVGHDENIRLLKGAGHPMFPACERRYIAGSIRYVHRALVSTGTGWLDAEPEIQLIQPDVYAVNEDGDRPKKRDYCAAHGIEYMVLKRTPKTGLPARQSTDLRGF